MLTQGDRESVVLAADRLTTSTRLRRWAARRGRQGLRITLAISFVVVLFLLAVLIWRPLRLIGLPDIGDPFDRPAAVAGDPDAFVLFRAAREKLRPMPDLPRSVTGAVATVGWSKADPKVREWVEANREAMDLFRRAAAQPDGIAHPVGDESSFSPQSVHLGPFVSLSALEGSRLEEQGDMARAWSWYRAVVAMRAHFMRRATVYERFFAEHNSKSLLDRVAIWAGDPRTDVVLLRRALDDVIATQPRPDWDVSSLAVDYWLAMRELDRLDGPLVHGDDEDLAYRIGGEALPPNLARSVYAAYRFVLNEPELSRRVLRLAFANWRSSIEDLGTGRWPAVRASFRGTGQNTVVPFYATGPIAPAGARAMSPQDLARWLIAAHDVKWFLSQWPWPMISIQERRSHRALLVLIAGELYRRERGAPPPSEQALVGPYLKSLPDDGTDDLADGETPIVVENPESSQKVIVK
jgi:hypothetical protein